MTKLINLVIFKTKNETVDSIQKFLTLSPCNQAAYYDAKNAHLGRRIPAHLEHTVGVAAKELFSLAFRVAF